MQLATMITMNDRAMLGPSPRREPARERGMPYQAPPPARQSAAFLRPMTAGTPFPLDRHLVALRGKRPLYGLPGQTSKKWHDQQAKGVTRQAAMTGIGSLANP